MEILENAHAKINLTLDVLFRRPDDYHELESVMQSLALADKVRLRRTEAGIKLRVSAVNIPDGEENLAWKAANLMFKTFNCPGGVEISLDKEIPVAAGLAGGSADAAAVLRGINKLWGLGQTPERLAELGGRLGSDVPFCVMQGTALAKGRGERLNILPNCPEIWLLLVKPPIEVSTAQVYGNLSLEKVIKRPETGRLVKALGEEDEQTIIMSLGNVLEGVTMSMVPEVKEIKRTLLEAGALNALMSGSGPTVFGLARNEAHAGSLAKVFNHTGYTVIVTKTYSGRGEQLWKDV